MAIIVASHKWCSLPERFPSTIASPACSTYNAQVVYYPAVHFLLPVINCCCTPSSLCWCACERATVHAPCSAKWEDLFMSWVCWCLWRDVWKARTLLPLGTRSLSLKSSVCCMLSSTQSPLLCALSLPTLNSFTWRWVVIRKLQTSEIKLKIVS